MWWPGHIPAGKVLDGMTSHMDLWPTLARMVGIMPPPHGAWKGNDGQPIYFDGYDNSAYILGRTDESARQDWVYIDDISFDAVRYRQWKFVFTAKDAWLGPDLRLGMGAALYNLRQDPGESYDMIFNGAAPPAAGVLKTSPGRYSGQDNGWAFLYANALVSAFTASVKDFPNIPTIPATASLGADVPKFVAPNLVAPRPARGARRRHAKAR
jgi:arylsulfatase